MPNSNPGASSDELEERIRQPEKKMFKGNLSISSVNRKSQRICQPDGAKWQLFLQELPVRRVPGCACASSDPSKSANSPEVKPIQRITKASVGFRLILVGSRRINGRSREEWSGLSESNRHLNLGKSEANGKSGTYEALSGALSSV